MTFTVHFNRNALYHIKGICYICNAIRTDGIERILFIN